MKKLLIVCTVIASISVGCKKDEISPQISSLHTDSGNHKNYETGSKNKSIFSGEDIFKGVFFLQGPVIQNLPSLKGYTDVLNNQQMAQGDSITKLYEQFTENIISTINSIDNQYFVELKNAVDGGNPILINDQLERGASNLIAAIEQIKNVNLEKLKDADPELVQQLENVNSPEQRGKILVEYAKNSLSSVSQQGTCLVFALAIAVYLGVVVDAGVAVNAAVAIDIWKWVALWGGDVSKPIDVKNAIRDELKGLVISPYKDVVLYNQLNIFPVLAAYSHQGGQNDLRKQQILLEISNL